jgi:hypothetical protein
MATMRTPNANILRELTEREREHAARGYQFAGSADERYYAAELLGRAIGHAAADEGWPSYTAAAAAVRRAVNTFTPAQRLTIAAAACPLAGL